MHIKIIETSTLAKTIFLTIGLTTLVGATVVFPSLPYIIKYFTNDKNKPWKVKRTFLRIQKQELLKINEKPDGKIEITITDKGKQKVLLYHLDQIKPLKRQSWDHFWRVVIFDIPESKKQFRDIFREYLKRLGFIQLQRSVFVNPHPSKDHIDFLKHNFNVSDYVTFVEARSIDNEEFLRNHFQV